MANQVISFHYTLSNSSGQVLDSSEGHEPLSFITGIGQIIPKLEEELVTMEPGDKKRIEISADEGYGQYDEDQIVAVPRAQMPPQEINVGDMFMADEDPNGMPLVVTEVSDTHITMDGNHPLAGVDLIFDVELASKREATDEEMEHGHVHGPDGHHH